MDDTSVSLRSGLRLPLVGLGTFPLRGDDARRAVETAVGLGYRSIDTAARYRNEDAVGAAVSAARAAGEDVLVTTKMATDQVGYEREALQRSLDALGLGHVDLWLIHWPPGGSPGIGSWRELVRARQDGLVSAIGVSNYSIAQIDALIDETGVAPDVVQRSWSPVEFDAAYLEACASRGVVLCAHSPLRNTPLDDPAIAAAAERHGRTPAQVVLRWNVQHGVAAVPKSAHPERMAQNLDVHGFALGAEEMGAIDALAAIRATDS
jgi:2,5-diketo-D-gluconate reductase A